MSHNLINRATRSYRSPGGASTINASQGGPALAAVRSALCVETPAGGASVIHAASKSVRQEGAQTEDAPQQRGVDQEIGHGPLESHEVTETGTAGCLRAGANQVRTPVAIDNRLVDLIQQFPVISSMPIEIQRGDFRQE